MDSRVKSRFWKRIHKIKNFQRPKNHVKIWVLILVLTPQKNRQLCTRYARVMHNFFGIFKSHAKSAKKVLKSIDFRTFWSECRDSNSRPLEPHSSAIPNFATPGYHIHLLHHVSLITIPHSFLFCKPYFRFFCIFYGSGSRSPTAPPPTPAGYPGTGPHPVLCR